MFLPHPSQSREGVSASGSPGLQVLRAEVPGAVAGPLGTAAATALAPRASQLEKSQELPRLQLLSVCTVIGSAGPHGQRTR